MSVVAVCGICGSFAAACSTDGGSGDSGSDTAGHTTKPPKIAGGQSDNDGSGSYSCDLTDATVSETPIDTVPEYANCSPADAVASLSWATTAIKFQQSDPEHSVIFDCGGFGRYVVEVGPATRAQLRKGWSPSDTSEDTPDQPCVAFVVESAIHVVSLDGGEPFEAQKFDTDHICWDASFTAERADGAKLTAAGDIATGPIFDLSIVSGTTTVACERTRMVHPPWATEPDPTVPDPTPGIGGAGGEGGATNSGHGGAGPGGPGGDGGARP